MWVYELPHQLPYGYMEFMLIFDYLFGFHRTRWGFSFRSFEPLVCLSGWASNPTPTPCQHLSCHFFQTFLQPTQNTRLALSKKRPIKPFSLDSIPPEAEYLIQKYRIRSRISCSRSPKSPSAYPLTYIPLPFSVRLSWPTIYRCFSTGV